MTEIKMESKIAKKIIEEMTYLQVLKEPKKIIESLHYYRADKFNSEEEEYYIDMKIKGYSEAFKLFVFGDSIDFQKDKIDTNGLTYCSIHNNAIVNR